MPLSCDTGKTLDKSRAGRQTTGVRLSFGWVTLGCSLLPSGPQSPLPNTAPVLRLALSPRVPTLMFGFPSGPQFPHMSMETATSQTQLWVIGPQGKERK